MRMVAGFHQWARRQWRAHWPEWLAGEREPSSWPLHPPKEAEIAADPDGAARWVREWGEAEREGIAVEWAERRWAGVGRQRLPARASAPAAVMAELAGEAVTWARAETAAAHLTAAWPATSGAIQAVARRLGALDDAEVPRLLTVLGWLEAHPGSGLWERELPVPGVDTKWFERHRAVVLPLAEAIGAGGLRRRGVGFRVRMLDPGLAPGPASFSVGVEELRALDVTPGRVLISENVTVLDTLPPVPGAVAVHGMGFAAPTLAEVGWIERAQQIYWGDLDTHGLAILGQVRAALPRVSSLLMDRATLAAHLDRAVPEPRPFRGEIGYLTAGELEALAALRAEGLRLEQERIPRQAVAAALRPLAG